MSNWLFMSGVSHKLYEVLIDVNSMLTFSKLDTTYYCMVQERYILYPRNR